MFAVQSPMKLETSVKLPEQVGKVPAERNIPSRLAPNRKELAMICPRCGGSGSDKGHICPVCNGNGAVADKR